jgi:hypothetical protein
MIQLHVLPISFSFLPFFAAHNCGATDPHRKKKTDFSCLCDCMLLSHFSNQIR